MQYKHRWYYVVSIFFSIILSGFFYDIQPRLTEAAALRETEKQLIQDLSILREFVNHRQDSYVNKDIQSEQLTDIYALAHKNGLSIQSVNLLGQRPEITNVNVIHLAALGNFVQIAKFLFSINLQPTIMLMTDFSYKAEQHNKFLINMDMLLWQDGTRKTLIKNHPKNISPLYNPFCFDANELRQQFDVEWLQQIPLDQFKMIGYLQQTNRVTAIISMPNDVIIDVHEGFVLGKEHAVVKHIGRDAIVFDVNGIRQRILKMEDEDND